MYLEKQWKTDCAEVGSGVMEVCHHSALPPWKWIQNLAITMFGTTLWVQWAVLSSVNVGECPHGTLLLPLFLLVKLYRNQYNLGRTRAWHHFSAQRFSPQMNARAFIVTQESVSCPLMSSLLLTPCLLPQFLPQPVQMPFPLPGIFLLWMPALVTSSCFKPTLPTCWDFSDQASIALFCFYFPLDIFHSLMYCLFYLFLCF